MNKIGITMGDPAGVGPELVVRISKNLSERNAYVIYGEERVIREATELVGEILEYRRINAVEEVNGPGVYLVDLGVLRSSRPEPSVLSGKVAVACLARAVANAVRGNLDGILTMPINKFWAKKAGFAYEGQTEYLANATGTKEFAMMFYSKELKVVLLSTHVPLSVAAGLVKKERVKSKVELVVREFRRLFRKEPRVGVLGLNPHAGEGGEIGREDVEEILPAVEELREAGLNVDGPLVPDTAFLKRDLYDVFLCMYHDQGLIPFKLLAFREGVNLTLGLPFPRTSPDHGTAYDIAWRGLADPTSSERSLKLLEELIDLSHKEDEVV